MFSGWGKLRDWLPDCKDNEAVRVPWPNIHSHGSWPAEQRASKLKTPPVQARCLSSPLCEKAQPLCFGGNMATPIEDYELLSDHTTEVLVSKRGSSIVCVLRAASRRPDFDEALTEERDIAKHEAAIVVRMGPIAPWSNDPSSCRGL